MDFFKLIVVGFFTIGGYALIGIPNGLVGLSAFTIASHCTDSLAMAALLSGLAGVLWAQLLFAVILPLPFKPFSFPRLPFTQMVGWYIAYGLGYSLGAVAATYLHQAFNLPWPMVFSLVCCGVLPLAIAGALKPLGIVGFPNRKFDL